MMMAIKIQNPHQDIVRDGHLVVEIIMMMTQKETKQVIVIKINPHQDIRDGHLTLEMMAQTMMMTAPGENILAVVTENKKGDIAQDL